MQVRFLSLRPSSTSELVNAPLPQSGLAGFDPLVLDEDMHPHWAGRPGEADTHAVEVRSLPGAPCGSRSLGEHRHDKPDQGGSIPPTRTMGSKGFDM